MAGGAECDGESAVQGPRDGRGESVLLLESSHGHSAAGAHMLSGLHLADRSVEGGERR